MKIKLFYCIDDDYSDDFKLCELKHGVLSFPDGIKIEVDIDLNPAIIGWSDGRFNVMFRDKEESENENDRKYFGQCTYWEKQKILWIMRKHILQQREIKIRIIESIIAFAIGLLSGWISFKC